MINRRGFMLIELMLAVILSTLVMLSLYAIFNVTFSTQRNTYSASVIQEGAALSVKSIMRDLETTGFVRSPASPLGAPTRSNILWGCANFDPNLTPAPSQMIDPSAGIIRNFYYCLDASSNIYYYFDNGPGNCNAGAPTGVCGAAGGWPNGAMRLAQNVTPDSCCNDPQCGNPVLGQPGCTSVCPNIFCRTSNDSIRLHYVVTGATPTFTVNTSVSMMASQR